MNIFAEWNALQIAVQTGWTVMLWMLIVIGITTLIVLLVRRAWKLVTVMTHDIPIAR